MFRNHYFRIITKNLTKYNILQTFAPNNNRKFADYNLKKIVSLVVGLDRSCPWPPEGLSSKSRSLASDFFESLASNVEYSTPPLANAHFLFTLTNFTDT